jgi:dihydroorotate dehydrogenase (NAD+) catalytic subunit
VSTALDLSPTIGGKRWRSFVSVASGTFGYGSEYERHLSLDAIGALFTKAVTRTPRPGNDVPRIIETTAGLLNSIGLANDGQLAFVRHKLPHFAEMPCAVIVNVAADTPEEYGEVVAFLEEHDGKGLLWGYELNVSCPNVKRGGISIGSDPSQVERAVRGARDATTRPLIAKLTPNVTDIAEIARAAESAGADAVSAINTLVGMVIDVDRIQPVLPAGTGGLSGPAILPVGVAAVYRIHRAVRIPVIGIGGIMNGRDALQYLLAGASAVQVGTANFVDPRIPELVRDEVHSWAMDHGVTSLEEINQLLR